MFFTSAAVLVLEILAGRLLAPYVGVTLETYTGIIGVVLAGISLGTWYGGRLADRVDPRRTLGPLLMFGGAAALCTLPAIRIFGSALQGAGPVAVVLLSLVGFFVPAAILSAVSPTVVKLQLHDLGETGAVVGRLSALGTAGAIVGTFLTGFFLVSAFPSTPIVLGLGTILVAVGLFIRVRLSRAGGAVAGPLILAVLAATLTAAVPGPCHYESAYFCAQVLDDLPPCDGRTLFLDTLRHSCVHLDDPTALDFSYAQILSDVIGTIGDGRSPLQALHIGGGGFSMPRYIAATRPGSTSLVLELDPTLVRIAKEELGLVTSADLAVRVGDARVGVRDLPAAASYDLVIGDAFGGEAVPWHLTTTEFIEQVKARMAPDGIYAVNLIDNPPLGFARAEAATLGEVFEHVAVIAPPGRLDRRDGGNFVLLASDAPLDTDSITAANQRRGDDDEIATGERLEQFVGGAPVLTDDYAPVDQLLTPLG